MNTITIIILMDSNVELIQNSFNEECKNNSDIAIDHSSIDESIHFIIENENTSLRYHIALLPPIYLADPNFKLRNDNVYRFSIEQRSKLVSINYQSKRLCFLSIFDLILVSSLLTFGIIIFVGMMFVFIFPIIGFIGSRKYSIKLCSIYFAYILCILAGRGYLLYENFSIPILVIQGLVALLELYILFVLFSFVAALKKLNSDEMLFLLGILPPLQNDIIPDNATVKAIESPPLLYEVTINRT